MKLLVVILVVLAISQTLALPTNVNGAEIEFLEDTNVYPPSNANEQKTEFLQEDEAENLEEALYTYTELLKGFSHKSGKQPINELNNEMADYQTTALCTDPDYCDCSQLKYASYQGTNKATGEPCTVFNVPHCEGVCSATHRYYAVQDGAEPISRKTYKCCLATNTVNQNFFTMCQKSNGNYYSFSMTYNVPSGCECSSSSPCSH